MGFLVVLCNLASYRRYQLAASLCLPVLEKRSVVVLVINFTQMLAFVQTTEICQNIL